MKAAPETSGSAHWQFDPEVAQRFQQEARDHIPDYQRVIDLSADTLEQLWGQGSRDQAVCDVGSALGHTIDCLGQRGWTNVWGVESSQAMWDQSQHQDRVILSSEFPEDRAWDAVLANWTLHFVCERRAYMESVYRSLASGGLFIVTDKMTHTPEQEALYYAFKRANGVSDEVIAGKRQRLEGVLVTEPLTWYLNTLADIGFEDIQVINARWMFVTILARRR
jgi:tRNA (cmo5U34)-methyltransferase